MRLLLAAAVVALAFAAAGCSEAEETHPKQVKALAGGLGVSVEMPDGWERAERSLTPSLTDPREVLSVATFPLRPGDRGRCAHMPVTALEDLGARDAFVTLQERSMGARSPGFPPRPERFGPDLGGPSEATECAPRARFRDHWFAFREHNRTFHVLVAFGPQTTAATQEEAWAMLDSLRVERAGRG